MQPHDNFLPRHYYVKLKESSRNALFQALPAALCYNAKKNALQFWWLVYAPVIFSGQIAGSLH